MLLGNYHHNLQSGRRLAIPTQFRTDLGEKQIITRSLEHCLHVLPFNTWSALTQNLGSHPLAGSDSRNLRRLLAHDAYEVEYDNQGRILIPTSLCEWANLKKMIVIAGSIDWIELWDVEIYREFMSKLETQTQAIAERVKTYE